MKRRALVEWRDRPAIGVSPWVRRLLWADGVNDDDREWLRRHLEMAGVYAPEFRNTGWIVMTVIC